MWNYERRLQYPVNITKSNPKMALVIISQFGGPDGELAASMRYLSQRYSMPYRDIAGVLTDIGTEATEMLPSHTSPNPLSHPPLQSHPLPAASAAPPDPQRQTLPTIRPSH